MNASTEVQPEEFDLLKSVVVCVNRPRRVSSKQEVHAVASALPSQDFVISRAFLSLSLLRSRFTDDFFDQPISTNIDMSSSSMSKLAAALRSTVEAGTGKDTSTKNSAVSVFGKSLRFPAKCKMRLGRHG